MNEIDKLGKEFEIMSYFSEFYDEGIVINLYDEPKEANINDNESTIVETITDKDGNTKYLGVAEKNKENDVDLFELFYQKKFEKHTLISKSTIQHEINYIENKYKPLFEINKYRVLNYWIDFLTIKLESIGNIEQITTEKTTKNQLLKDKLTEYGFFELEKVKILKKENQLELVESFVETPYTIAMFEYLDFFRYLITNHFKTKTQINKELSEWFNVGERTVKGNINVLNTGTCEKEERYTAIKYKEKVIIDYNKLR